MILLFTSAREGRPYYKRDLLNVCCDPPGREISFGYRKKWVAENLKSAERLTDKDALIVFCERDVTGARFYKYHPIRLAKIVAAKPDGGSLTILLQLAGLFDYEKYASQMPRRITEFEQYVLSSEDQPTPSIKDRHAAFVREDKDWDKDDFSGSWLALVEYLSHLEGLKNCTFFCELGAELPGSKMPRLSCTETKGPGRLQYSVEAGKSYQMTYRVFFGQDAAQRPLGIVVSEKIASIRGPFLSQWSSGFEVSFVLNFTRSFESETSTLSVTGPSQMDGKIEAPEIHALLKINVARYVLPSAIFLMTMGSMGLSLEGDHIFSSVLGRDLMWLAKVAGAMALALGSFIGFRKLPFAGD